LLATRHELVEQRWAAAVRTQVVSRSASAPARELAEQAAQAAAQEQAELQCRNLATLSARVRLRATRVDAQAPVCEPESRPAGWACSVEAQAHCQVDEASEVRTEHCD
jgi:hypothetical protein